MSEKETLPKGTLLPVPVFLYQGLIMSAGALKQNRTAERLAVLVPAETPLPTDAIRIRRSRSNGHQPVVVPVAAPSGLTFRELWKRYSESKLPDLKPSTRQDYEGSLTNYLLPRFADRRIADLRKPEIQDFINQLRTTVGCSAKKTVLSGRTVQKIYVTLQSLLSFARDQEYIPVNICNKLSLPKRVEAEKAFFEHGEVPKLIETVPDGVWKTAIVLASQTGLRRAEIFGLRVGDLRDGWLTVQNARSFDGQDDTPKSGKKRQTPISKRVADMLRTHLAGRKSGYVFLSKARTYYKGTPQEKVIGGGAIGLREASDGLDILLKAAGMKRPGLGWHSFRRYRAEELNRIGVPSLTVMAWLGWADVKTMNRYLNPTEPVYAAQMVEKL
jgi:integrase